MLSKNARKLTKINEPKSDSTAPKNLLTPLNIGSLNTKPSIALSTALNTKYISRKMSSVSTNVSTDITTGFTAVSNPVAIA